VKVAITQATLEVIDIENGVGLAALAGVGKKFVVAGVKETLVVVASASARCANGD
jgi:peptide deformylase